MKKPVTARRHTPLPDLKAPESEPQPESSDLEKARQKNAREAELRAAGKPTLRATFGDMLKAHEAK